MYRGDSRPPIPPCVMASSAMGLKLGVFRFLPTTHTKTNAIQMRPRSLCAVQRFTHVYLHAKTTVDTGNIRIWQTKVILITGKTCRPQFEPHVGIKMAQVLGSPMYIYGFYPYISDSMTLTGGNWQKWKRVFLTCPCHKIYRDEAIGLKSCKYTWKITKFVKMGNLGQYREKLIFCQ